MPKFILIDNSITGIGGHYYEYAIHVLNAAQQAGFTPVLAANRRFADAVPSYIQVQPMYRFGIWLHQTVPFVARFTRPRARATADVPVAQQRSLRRAAGWGKRALLGAVRRLIHRMLTVQFRRDTERLFQRVPLAEGDVVFIPSPNLAEMRGLLGYFPRDARAPAATWHLLFRRSLLHGREEDYAAQHAAVAEFRAPFQAFQQRLQRTARVLLDGYRGVDRSIQPCRRIDLSHAADSTHLSAAGRDERHPRPAARRVFRRRA